MGLGGAPRYALSLTRNKCFTTCKTTVRTHPDRAVQSNAACDTMGFVALNGKFIIHILPPKRVSFKANRKTHGQSDSSTASSF